MLLMLVVGQSAGLLICQHTQHFSPEHDMLTTIAQIAGRKAIFLIAPSRQTFLAPPLLKSPVYCLFFRTCGIMFGCNQHCSL